MEEPSSTEQGSSSGEDWHETLKGFLSVSSLKSALEDLELQDSTQELLERNAKALARLEELQLRRYGDLAGSKPVEVGSEEWETGNIHGLSQNMHAYVRPQLTPSSILSPY